MGRAGKLTLTVRPWAAVRGDLSSRINARAYAGRDWALWPNLIRTRDAELSEQRGQRMPRVGDTSIRRMALIAVPGFVLPPGLVNEMAAGPRCGQPRRLRSPDPCTQAGNSTSPRSRGLSGFPGLRCIAF